MGTNQQRTWWQEMGAISRGLMFIEGSITTPASLQESERPKRPVTNLSPQEQKPGKANASSMKRKARRLLDDLMLLGGRPETVHHNDDIDEPFPALHRRRVVRDRSASRRQVGPPAQTQTCPTC